MSAMRRLAAAFALCCLTLDVNAQGVQGSVEREVPSLILFGAFTHGGVWQGDAAILELEQQLGRELDIIHWYQNWDTDWDEELVASVAYERRIPMISWQSRDRSVRDIAAGMYDDYIRSWARGVSDFHRPVYMRPFPEMNGDWTDWNGDPEGLVRAWIRITAIFREEGAHNAFWVWSPNVTDDPRTEANRMEHYFPGPAYVDVLALDGFNWGTTRESGWRSAEEVFRTGYDRIAALARRPIWFAEIGSTDEGGDKAQWVRDLLLNAYSWFPRLTAIVWFDEDKETDWRIASSADVVRMFRLLP